MTGPRDPRVVKTIYQTGRDVRAVSVRPTARLALCGPLVVVEAATGAALTAQRPASSSTDADEAELTRTVVSAVGAGAESAGGNFDGIRVDHSRETPSADDGNGSGLTTETPSDGSETATDDGGTAATDGGNDGRSGGGGTGADGLGSGVAVAATALLLAAPVAGHRD